VTFLIGINGFKRSGKNTAGTVIKTWAETHDLRCMTVGFADRMKLSAARSLGIYSAQSVNDAIVLMDSLKESGTVDVCIPEQSIMKSMSGREFLKWFATEGHRDVFGDDFWVDHVLPLSWDDIEVGSWPDILAITDLRFANEARRVKALQGVTLEIVRPGLYADSDGHGSEQSLPRELVDFTIYNDSSLEAFEINVIKWIDKITKVVGVV
jgi:Deoxynucleotide monophosphate kinase